MVEWYSNEIWGKRQDDDDLLFEVMSLQVFQAGLTWRMIIERRDAFKRAFLGWRIDEVAEMDSDSVDRILQDASIIRNRRKVEACITNARAIQTIRREHGSFCRWFYDILEGDALADLQKALKANFSFMGPETSRMWLMASGRIPSS
jgi:DNA-3-methyladenine glycosylase I